MNHYDFSTSLKNLKLWIVITCWTFCILQIGFVDTKLSKQPVIVPRGFTKVFRDNGYGFIGKRGWSPQGNSGYFIGKKSGSPYGQDYFIGKRGYDYFIGKRSNEEEDMRKRMDYFIGKRSNLNNQDYFIGKRSPSQEYFIGKRGLEKRSLRAGENANDYFIGKRNNEKKSINPDYFIGKRSLADFSQNMDTCERDSDCKSNYCCAYSDDQVKKTRQLYPQVRPKPVCQPMGSSGDMCFAPSSSAKIGIGCSCSPGFQCVTFAGYAYGICVEGKK